MNFFIGSKNFLAIIFGAAIIGGCIYAGIKISDIDVNTKIVGKSSVRDVVSKPKTTQTPVKKEASSNISVCGASENTVITKVIDGDTVIVEGGWHIRLLGIDADEKGYPCYDSAKTRLENLILAKQVTLKKDVSDVDQYGRCLRYIFLNNINVGEQLVKEGLAVARFYNPDLNYRTEITADENYAQKNRVGCKWSGLSQLSK